jgi:hypothetical protein
MRIMRRTKTHVWLRSTNFGTQRRGLSIKYTIEDFEAKYLPVPKRTDTSEQLYVHSAKMANS